MVGRHLGKARPLNGCRSSRRRRLRGGAIANVWLLAAPPIVAVPLGMAEAVYGWRLRKQSVATTRTLATVAIVVGAVIAVAAGVYAVGQPVGHFGSSHHDTGTVTTESG